VVLRRELAKQSANQPDTGVIDELGLCRGQVRIDLAVVNGLLHGYEIKSDRDRLDRLPSQVEVYSKVLDRATIVVGPRHLEEARRTVPGWWGVLRVAGTGADLRLVSARRARDNPNQVPRALVELLWREEALALLETRQADHGVRSKPRPAVWDRVCEAFDASEIATAVREGLKTRMDRPGTP
jgi:hypothetical protein